MLGAASVANADLQFGGQVAAGLARTDNLTLARSDKESQTIYQLVPSFTLAQQSTRVTSSASYRVEGYRYSERQDSSVYDTLDGRLSVALDPNNFFLELGATRGQTAVSPEDPIPTSNILLSRNRADRDETFFGPTFQYPVGSSATVRGTYRRAHVQYGQVDPAFASLVRSFDTDIFTTSVDNYRKLRGFTWAAV